jgi:hypothetical protein
MDIVYRVNSLKETYLTVEYSCQGESTLVGFEIPSGATPEQVDILISAHTPHNYFAVLLNPSIALRYGTVPFVDLTQPLGDQSRVSSIR